MYGLELRVMSREAFEARHRLLYGDSAGTEQRGAAVTASAAVADVDDAEHASRTARGSAAAAAPAAAAGAGVRERHR